MKILLIIISREPNFFFVFFVFFLDCMMMMHLMCDIYLHC